MIFTDKNVMPAVRQGDGALDFAETQVTRLAGAGSEAGSTEWQSVILAIEHLKQEKKKRRK